MADNSSSSPIYLLSPSTKPMLKEIRKGESRFKKTFGKMKSKKDKEK